MLGLWGLPNTPSLRPHLNGRPYWAGTETSVAFHRDRPRSWPVLGARPDRGHLRLRGRELTVAAPAGSLSRKAQKQIHQVQPGFRPATTALPATPTSAQAYDARRCEGDAGSVPSAPRMRPGGGGCQGDESFQEPLVLAIVSLEVSRGGLWLLGSSSRGFQDVLLLEQESEFPRVRPRSSSGFSVWRGFRRSAREAMRSDPGFAIPSSTFRRGPASDFLLRVPEPTQSLAEAAPLSQDFPIPAPG